MLLLWLGLDTYCPFLMCVFLGASPSHVDLSMPPHRWAWLSILGTVDFWLYTYVLNICPAHNNFVLGVVARVLHLAWDKKIIVPINDTPFSYTQARWESVCLSRIALPTTGESCNCIINCSWNMYRNSDCLCGSPSLWNRAVHWILYAIFFLNGFMPVILPQVSA